MTTHIAADGVLGEAVWDALLVCFCGIKNVFSQQICFDLCGCLTSVTTVAIHSRAIMSVAKRVSIC